MNIIKAWTIKQLWDALSEDLSKCNTPTERSCCLAIGKKEIRQNASKIDTSRSSDSKGVWSVKRKRNMIKLYKLPTKLETMDEQIRSGSDDSNALQAECSKTEYGHQIAAELVKRYNCHEELIEEIKRAARLMENYARQFSSDKLANQQMTDHAAFFRDAIAKAEGK